MIKTQEPSNAECNVRAKPAKFTHGVMEGDGAYNKHAQSQGAVAALAIPFLQKALGRTAFNAGGQPIMIADYGSSQGKNSLAPIGTAIRDLRPRIGASRPIFVFHVDQPSNDFSSLFEILSSDPHRYDLEQSNVFPCAIGRSFYEQVLPPESVDVAWSSSAAMWLSAVPSLIPGHFWSIRSTGAARVAFERQAAKDWEAFLSARGREMRAGARMIVVLPTPPDDLTTSGVADLMDSANAVLQGMVEEGAITAAERAAMVLAAHPRRKGEVLAPFARDGSFRGLTLEDYAELELSDGSWAEYQKTGDKQALARKRALFFRSTFTPSLASALTRVREGHPGACLAFADRLESGLTQRLVSNPVRMDILTQIITLAKLGPTLRRNCWITSNPESDDIASL